MTELRNTDAGRILLGLLILTIGAFLVLINLQLSSFEVVGLWPLFLIVPGAIMLSMVIIVSPPQSSGIRLYLDNCCFTI